MTHNGSSNRGTRPLGGALRSSWQNLPLGTQLGLAATSGALAMILLSTFAYMITPRLEAPDGAPKTPRALGSRPPGGPTVKTEVMIPPGDTSAPTTVASDAANGATGSASPMDDDTQRVLDRRRQEDQALAAQQRLEDEKRAVERRLEDQQLEAKRRSEDQQIEDQRRTEEKQRRDARDAENRRLEDERKQKQQSASSGDPKFAAVP